MTYYVNSVSGSDSNDGSSPAQAFLTLDKLFNEMVSGDTGVLAASTTTYTWTGRTGGNSLPDNITLECDMLPNVVTEVAATVDAGGNLRTWELDGSFTARNIWFKDNIQSSAQSSAFYLDTSFTGNKHILFENCIHSGFRAGATTGGRGGYIGKSGNLSADQANSQLVEFKACLFFGMDGLTETNSAIFRPSFAGSFLMENCTLFIEPPSAEPLYGIITGVQQSSVIIRNVIIHNISGNNLMLHGESTGTAAGAARAATLEGSVYNNIVTTNVTITESTNGDPLFLDITTNDYRVRQNSPAIDRGVLV
jgi:hypothetical protein